MDCFGSGEGEKKARRDKMKSRTAKRNRKSTVRLSDELASMDAETKYLTPIFGSEASDVEMPYIILHSSLIYWETKISGIKIYKD